MTSSTSTSPQNLGAAAAAVPALAPAAESARAAFDRLGYLAGESILGRAELRHVVRAFRALPATAGADWEKGKAVTSRLYYEIATHPRIVARVGELLGDDVMLWGASLVHRRAGQVHAWHTDYETSSPDHRCVSVWLGLRHVSARSSLAVVSRSHRLRTAVKDVQLELGQKSVSADALLTWAQRRDPQCELSNLPCRPGEAIFFDGRLWHGSDNGNLLATRVALLLQYATPRTPIRIPDFSRMAWPPRFYEHPLPATIMITGTDDSGEANRTVPPPAPHAVDDVPQLRSLVRPVALPLPHADDARGWTYHHQFRGATSNVSDLECHASVLSPGKTPHAPHAHPEEEVLVVLHGDATLLVDDAGEVKPRPAPAGSVIYYPKGHRHSITNASAGPITYVMFKWTADGAPAAGATLPLTFLRGDELSGAAGGTDAFRTKLLFEGPTGHLRKLHAHATTLRPGGGYAAHVDAHDVLIVLLEGVVETLGRRVEGVGSLVFCAAGEPHGMRNAGPANARYLVLEFHGRHASTTRDPHPLDRAATRHGGYTLGRLKGWVKRKLKRRR